MACKFYPCDKRRIKCYNNCYTAYGYISVFSKKTCKCKYRKLNNSWSGVEKLLLDKCNRIQDGAIYILKHHSDINLRDFFVQAALLEPSIPAIKGIEKCGDHAAAQVLLDCLSSLTGKRLSQALIAISVLVRNECETTYWEYLSPRQLACEDPQ